MSHKERGFYDAWREGLQRTRRLDRASVARVTQRRNSQRHLRLTVALRAQEPAMWANESVRAEAKARAR